MDVLKSYRPDIDGMRAIAVLSVVAYHYGMFAPGGFVGVDVFFVISGYLIGSLIYRQACEGGFSYQAFYVRRARRILPALLVVLGVTYLVMLAVATPAALREYAATALATLLSGSNIQLWRSFSYFHPTAELNPLLMTWSLGVEEQFYLLAPMCLLLLPKLAVRWRLLALGALTALSLALAAWMVGHRPGAAFYLLPTRAWELAAGVLVGVLEIHRIGLRARGWVVELGAVAGLGLIVAPVFLYGIETPFPGLAAVPPVLGTVVLLGTASSAVNRRLLSLSPMRAVGLVSYSLYLWHWPLISMARLVLEREPPVVLRAVLLALSGVLAAASYRYVEVPFRRARTPARTALMRYAGALGVLAAAVGSAAIAQGYPQRWPRRFVAQTDHVAHAVDPCLALHQHAVPRTSGDCYPDAPRLVAVVGDSHAAALAPGLRSLARRHGLGLVQLTKASCPFLVGVSRKVAMHPELLRDCAVFDRRVMDLLRQDARIGTVIIAGAWRAGSMRASDYTAVQGPARPPDVLLEHGLARAVRALKQSGKRVLLVRDVPFLELRPLARLAACASPLDGLLNGHDPADDCEVVGHDDVATDMPAQAILVRVARHTGAPLVDPRRALCDPDGCRIARDGRPLYRDRQHLSPLGASLASGAFEPILRKVLAAQRLPGGDGAAVTAGADHAGVAAEALGTGAPGRPGAPD